MRVQTHLSVLLLLCFFAGGCLTYRAHAKQSGSKVRPSDIRPEPGETLHLAEDSVLMKTQGTTLTAVGHHELVPAAWIRLAPKGARVTVLDPEASQEGRVGSTDTLGKRNPWYYVEVVDSPREEQVGWRGWLHNSGFARSAPDEQRTRTTATLVEKAWVCPDGDAMGLDCEISLARGTEVEVYDCKRFAVGAATWNEQGHYLFGWIARPRFESDPCE
ncbi:MAG: hypothetical protein ACQEVA_03860 [Myxococcota bacterium]